VKLWLRDVHTAPTYDTRNGRVSDIVLTLLSVPCRGTAGTLSVPNGYAELRIAVTEAELVEALRDLVTKRAAAIVGTAVTVDLHGTLGADGQPL
jgi:hypothetical protein